MKKNRIFSVLSGMALLLCGACSSENLLPGEGPDVLDPDGSGGFYMSVDFQMPGGNGTRSETIAGGGSTGGEEVGSNEENNVSSALIVLAASEAKSQGETSIEEYGFLVMGEVQNNRITTLTTTNQDVKEYRAVARMQKDNLSTFYNLYWNQTNQSYSVPEVYVFVFANPTKALVNLFDPTNTPFGSGAWTEEICKVIQGDATEADFNVGIWSANSFLMNNVSLAKRKLPSKLLDWEYFTTIDKPFRLSDTQDEPEVKVDNSEKGNGGPVKVERSVARFDFKDGSAKGNNTYNVLYLTNKQGDIDDKYPIVSIELQKMCLVNMSNAFYFLPRVSADGQNTNATLLGREIPWTRDNGLYKDGNYVVGPYATVFANGGPNSGFPTYFNYSFFDKDGTYSSPDDNNRWNVVKISDVLNGRADNYEGTETNKVTKGSYRVWRYVTENVIPAETSSQTNGNSTGVVFKGKLKGTDVASQEGLYEEYWNIGYIQNLANCLDNKGFTFNGVKHSGLTGNSKEDPILYYFAGRLYLGWRHIRQAAIQASITISVDGKMEINRSNSLYKAVFGDGPIPGGEKYHCAYVPNDGTAEAPVAGKPVYIEDPQWNSAWGDADADEKFKNDAGYQNYIKSANYAWYKWSVDGERETGSEHIDEMNAMRSAMTGAGITLYESSHDTDFGNGYYCYYYYWNRHNDNGIDGTMCPMEFAVVRNNVYKLSVDKISRIGHPRIPENDPNPPTPNTPDENDEIYLDVRVQIVPWTVRVNSIHF